MRDLIDRQAAIDAINKALDRETLLNSFVRKVAIDAVKELPPAQPGWIPVTERLPQDDTEVIVSCTDDSGDDEFSYVTTGWHYKGLWVVNNDRCYFVRAWQPLPEKPWEGGQDERSD